MKTLIVLLFAFFAVFPAQAQTPGQPSSHGFRWYVAPVAHVSQVNGETGVFDGFQAGWIVNDHLTLGFEANQLESDVEADRPGPEGSPYLYLWYGGLTAEYGIQAMPRLRLAGRALVGGGEAHWRDSNEDWRFGNREKDEDHTTSFVFEPGLHAAYAINGWMQATAGVSYRYAGGGKSHAVSQDDLRSFSGSIGLRLGRF